MNLLQVGFHVIAVDLSASIEGRKSEIDRCEVTSLEADLSRPGSADQVCEAVARQTQQLSALVNNAAFTGNSDLGGYACAFEEQSDEAFDAALTLNLAVPFRLTRRLLPLLKTSGSGSVVNVASIYGLVGPDLSLYEGTAMGNPAGYAASKGGLIQLTRYLATVLAPDVRVNCVAPGGIKRDQPSEFVERYERRTPLRRMGTESDTASAIRWLLSDSAAYVTGQTIAVDGGWTAW